MLEIQRIRYCSVKSTADIMGTSRLRFYSFQGKARALQHLNELKANSAEYTTALPPVYCCTISQVQRNLRIDSALWAMLGVLQLKLMHLQQLLAIHAVSIYLWNQLHAHRDETTCLWVLFNILLSFEVQKRAAAFSFQTLTKLRVPSKQDKIIISIT